MLTDDEALAVILGLNGARRAALDPDAAAAVESAAAKVRRVLPQAIAARLGTLVASQQACACLTPGSDLGR